MKDKILEALKTKYKGKGFSAKALEGLADYLTKTITEDSQIEEGITGIEPLISTFQSMSDQKIKDAKMKWEMEKDKKPDPTPDPKKTEPDDDTPAWVKSLMETQTKITAELTALKTEKVAQNHQEIITAKLKEKNIPEKFFAPIIKGRMFKDEAEIDDYVGTIDSSYQDFAKEAGVVTTPAPKIGDPANNGKIRPEVEQHIKDRAEEKPTSDLGGKSLIPKN